MKNKYFLPPITLLKSMASFIMEFTSEEIKECPLCSILLSKSALVIIKTSFILFTSSNLEFNNISSISSKNFSIFSGLALPFIPITAEYSWESLSSKVEVAKLIPPVWISIWLFKSLSKGILIIASCSLPFMR